MAKSLALKPNGTMLANELQFVFEGRAPLVDGVRRRVGTVRLGLCKARHKRLFELTIN